MPLPQRFTSSTRSHFLAVTLASLMLALTACGTADSSESAAANKSSGPVDVCALLDSAQVEALLEDAIREPSSGRAVGLTLGRCTWTANNNGRTLSLWSVSIDRWDKFSERDGVETIDGLGARAVRLEDNGLYVDPGNRHYFLQAFVVDSDGSNSRELGAAAAALAVR